MADLGSLDDHDLLLVIATKLESLENTTAAMGEKVGVQNGRMSAVEKALIPQEDLPKRMASVERGQIRMGVILTAIGAGWPLLIYEVRQFFLEKFGFIPGG